ncbi:hypothetical protein JHK87_004401 [Glycine soja]|nr:hypothetical protein JHK87_004401 [Glycine soja]
MGVSLSTGNIIVASLEQIFHKEGLRGMYCGLAPTMLALLPFILPSIAVFLPNEIVPLAGGLTEFGDGRNQQSTSEAVNSYYVVGLIGLAYGHTYLLTRPMESTKFQ